MDRVYRIVTTPAWDDVKPLVSVIIPVYNYADVLSEAVESALAQPLRELEVVIVNDGSPDASSLVAETLIRRHPGRAIKLVDQHNSGEPAVARNTGIARSRGKFILPLDADDRLLPYTVPRFLKALEPFEREPVVVYGYIQCFGAHDSLWKNQPFHPNVILRQNQLPNTSLFSRELWTQTGGYPLEVPGYEDWGFWIGCAEAGARFVHLPLPAYLYRTTSDESLGKSAERKHEWTVAKLIALRPHLYEPEEAEWARDYLQRHASPPEKRTLHGDTSPYPWAAAMRIAAQPKLYSSLEIKWAAEYLEANPRKLTRGIDVLREPVVAQSGTGQSSGNGASSQRREVAGERTS